MLRTIQPEKEFITDEKAAKIAEKEMIDVSHDLLSPFASFPFLPFHCPKLRREANSTDKSGRIEKDPSKKPFFYVDFEFNIEKIPVKNQSKDNIIDQPRKGSPLEMLDDWPFFDDSPSLESDMEEFPPRSDLFSFDFPFHRRHGKTLGQNDRNSPKSVSSVVDILDNSMKRDIEPILDLASAKKIKSKNLCDSLLDRNKIGSIVKNNPYDILQRKAPVVLGKVVKIGEIHFGEDYSKGRKRRKTSTLGKKGNKGIQETSIELITVDEPKLPPLKDVFRRVHEFSGLSPKVDSEVIRLNNREGKELDPKTDDKTQIYSAAVKDRSSVDSDFAYVQQETPRKERKQEPKRDSIGFETLKPHSPFSRIRRQEVAQENATVPKEEISKNITHILGEFFSLMKKLHNSKLFYREKENQENDEVHCPALSGIRESALYANHDSGNGRRMPRNSSNEESSRKVADLVYLFLTVTLPTMLGEFLRNTEKPSIVTYYNNVL